MSIAQNLGTAGYVVANFGESYTGKALKTAWHAVKKAVVEDFREKFGKKEPLSFGTATDLAANGDMWNGKGLPTSYTKRVAYEDRDPNVKISHTRDTFLNQLDNIKVAFSYDRVDYVRRKNPAPRPTFSFGD